MFLCSLLTVISLYSTLSIDNWFITDSDMPRYDKFRIEEVVLSGDNPVVVGYVLDVNPTDNNRLFTVREYSLSGASATRVWYYNYEGGQWDDDGYAITSYRTDDDPPEERFIGTGFHQVDLNNDPQQSTAESGLAVLLDSDGDTVCLPHTFRGSWLDARCSNVTYIGDLSTYEETYAACGWYIDTASIMRGFIEIAYGNTQISLIEDSGIDGSWENILFDSEENLLVLGGFQEDENDGYGNIRLGCIDLTSMPYAITEQEDWGTGTYALLDGPLVHVDDGIYVCMGNGSNTSGVEGVALTLWSWDSSSSPSLDMEDSEVYTNDDEFDGYKDVSVFSTAFDDSVLPNGVVLILQATTDDEDEDYYIFNARVSVNLATMTLGSLSVTSRLEVIPETGYSLGARDFCFSSISPVEGVGGGAADYSSSSQKFWLFRIEDE